MKNYIVSGQEVKQQNLTNVAQPFVPQAQIEIYLHIMRELAQTQRANSKLESEKSFHLAMGQIQRLPDDDPAVDDLLKLYAACRTATAWVSSIESSEIGGAQVRFREKVASVLPGAKVVKGPKIKNRAFPDAWISYQDKIIPVEVKRTTFDRKALLQLQRYMQIYGCDHGIASAKRLAIELPLNIIFVEDK